MTALALALAGSIGIAAAWILVAQVTGRQSSWMAVVAAVDALLLLRMGGHRPGIARAAWAVLATLVAIALANWGIAADQVGRMLGLATWSSIIRLGPEHGWLLLGMANDAVDLAWLAAGLVVAAAWGR
jgi:hypothetical protein